MKRRAEDTAAGCRILADQDQVRAARTTSDRRRRLLEHSAEAWAARAALLERLESKSDVREKSIAVGKGRQEPEDATHG